MGGNLGTPLSEGVLQCLAFPAEDPPFSVRLLDPVEIFVVSCFEFLYLSSWVNGMRFMVGLSYICSNEHGPNYF